ncbi:MAG: hypothetical protein R3C53_00840 [Pirellulaceae bacterium]
MKWFQLIDAADDRSWAISVPPEQFDDPKKVWEFSAGKLVQVLEPIHLRMQQGNERDFSLTGFSIPVVTSRFREVVETLCPNEVQFFSATGVGKMQLSILNIPVSLDVIDYKNSTVQLCMNRGRAFRERYGKPEMVSKLVIKKNDLGGRSIFRVKDWRPAIIVNAKLKDALVDAAVTGIYFSEV